MPCRRIECGRCVANHRHVPAKPISSEKIALFPQALAAGEVCRPQIDASYHDMPTEEPKLMSELMMKSWPQRQWAARLYHAFKPLDRAEPVYSKIFAPMAC